MRAPVVLLPQCEQNDWSGAIGEPQWLQNIGLSMEAEDQLAQGTLRGYSGVTKRYARRQQEVPRTQQLSVVGYQRGRLPGIGQAPDG